MESRGSGTAGVRARIFWRLTPIQQVIEHLGGLFSFRLVKLCLRKLTRKMFLKEQINYLGIQISILFLT